MQYVTGHAENGKLPADFDWPGLVDPTATTIVYMAARTIAEFAALAVEHGLDPATPAIAVARATRPDERIIASTISDLPKQLAAQSVPGPLLVLIGRALAQYDAAAVAEAVDQARKQVNGD